jgi:hypothetical protein
MKRGAVILLLGLAVAVAAYACTLFFCTAPARGLQRSAQPELEWLKDEYKLSDAEFERIGELHTAYLPKCSEMCTRISEQQAKVEKLLANATNATPEIEAALAEQGRLQADCRTQMLRHFFEVSQTMPPEQGRRYMAWIKEKVFASAQDMSAQHDQRHH